jgi:hypothetical protein
MKVAPFRRPPLSAHTHTLAHSRTLGCIRRRRAYVRIHTHALLIHTYARTHVPSRARLVRARSRPARPRVGASAGPCERGGGRTHSVLRLGQSAAAGSAASSELAAYLRANRAAAPGGSGPPPTMRARGSAAADDRQRRRRRIQRRAAPAPGAAAPRAAAQRRHRRDRARRRRPARTHRVSKSLHWPSDSGSAFTFVEEMALPRTARACGPRPPRNNGQTWGRTGRSHGKETTHALNTHPHVRDKHTDAFGAATVP